MKRIVYLLILILALCLGVAAHAEGVEDGRYSVQVASNSSMFKIVRCVLRVEDGKMTATLTLSGDGYGYLYAGTAAEAEAAPQEDWIAPEIDAEGAMTFALPVPALDADVPVAAWSIKRETWYDRTLTFEASTLTALETPDQTGEAPLSSPLPDGEYVPDAFSYSGGSGKVTIECGAVRIAGGQATAVLRFSSPNYTWVKVDGVTYDGVANEAGAQFEIPVKLNADNAIVAQTMAMSRPHEVEYTIRVTLSGASGDKLPGLTYESSMTLRYATGFSVDFYAGGYALIDIAGSGRSLVVPEGGDVPEGLDADIAVLRRPLDRIYLAATSAMALFDRLDALDAIRLTSVQPSGWSVEGAVQAMDAGRILYGGKYSEPDYELLIREGCDLAIESTMIEHSPKVKELLELLGIPVLVERASYEAHPLGRSEWIRLYGVLTGKEDEAEAFMQAQEESMAALQDFTNTGKTVAFFYIGSNGTAMVRAASDYVPKMIELAGGKPLFADLADEESARSTLSISLETFYAAAVDADYLVYNAAIDDPLTDLDDLLAKSPLFADFKAVKEGNVFCTGKSLYQATDIAADMILDFHRMLTGDEDHLRYLYPID